MSINKKREPITSSTVTKLSSKSGKGAIRYGRKGDLHSWSLVLTRLALAT